MSQRAWWWLGAILLASTAAATEQREPCAAYVVTRQPFFGELHLHTAYSADAATLDTRNTPRDAYRFARGEQVGIPPYINRCRDVDEGQPGCPSNGGTGPVSEHPYCVPPYRCDLTAARVSQQPAGRALDFAAVTDHAEWLGETNVCFWEGTVSCAADGDCQPGQICLAGEQHCVPRGYASPACVLARADVSRLRAGVASVLFAQYILQPSPRRLPFCAEPGAYGDRTCIFQAKNVWEQIISDAEEAYDRTASCSFTSFIAYEYSHTPTMGICAAGHQVCFADVDCATGDVCQPNTGGGNNLHRNIIFNNANVIDQPISDIEAPTGCGKGAQCVQGGIIGSPVDMLMRLRAQCNDSNGCDFLSIPHNSNLSGGAMFLMPENDYEAGVRGALEPLVEIFQIKGGSECRFSTKNPGAWDTVDEQCDFENESFGKLAGVYFTAPDAINIPPGSYVRNALKLGLAYEAQHGINPYKLGFVGSTDAHSGTPGQTDAVIYAKNGAHGDQSFAEASEALNDTLFLGLEANGGGLTGVWAEENTRDSLFAAMKRRETFGTSGTRPVVRLFGGFGLDKRMCQRGDFAEQGYATGVPMGGTIGSGPPGHRPRFAVAASMDPGWSGHPGTRLQRVQIVKGWVDSHGKTHEQVYDVAGRDTHATVDLATCTPQGKGHTDLCGEWTDPDFDPTEHAFYYARVLENPSCRWTQYYCNARGIDCSQPPSPDQELAGYTKWDRQQCCSGDVPATVQQRAWSSPIWYQP